MKTFLVKTFIPSVAPGFFPGITGKLLFFALFAFSLTGCQTEVIGPEGPPGQDGNANVRIVNIINQSIFLNPLLNSWEIIVDVEEITREIMNNGFVSAFLAPANNNNRSWTALPEMFSPDLSAIPAIHFDYEVFTGRVAIYTFSEPAFQGVDVRVVIIEGS